MKVPDLSSGPPCSSMALDLARAADRLVEVLAAREKPSSAGLPRGEYVRAALAAAGVAPAEYSAMVIVFGTAGPPRAIRRSQYAAHANRRDAATAWLVEREKVLRGEVLVVRVTPLGPMVVKVKLDAEDDLL